MPEETYFLSLHTDTVNVKVRDGLLDIKTKTGETPEGYEIFQPRGKFQFPVQREELATILQHLQSTWRWIKSAIPRRIYQYGAGQ